MHQPMYDDSQMPMGDGGYEMYDGPYMMAGGDFDMHPEMMMGLDGYMGPY